MDDLVSVSFNQGSHLKGLISVSGGICTSTELPGHGTHVTIDRFFFALSFYLVVLDLLKTWKYLLVSFLGRF